MTVVNKSKNLISSFFIILGTVEMISASSDLLLYQYKEQKLKIQKEGASQLW